MDSQALEQFLRATPLFTYVEPHEVPELLGVMTSEQLTEGQTLFRERDPGDALWVLGEGAEVALSTAADGGEPVVVARARSGETVGEMALVDEGGRSATAVVTRAGPAHRIAAADFTRLREGFRPAAYKVLRKICVDLCARLRATDRRIAPEGKGVVPHTKADFGVPVEPELMDEFAPFRKLPQVVKLALANQVRLIETEEIQPLFGEGAPAEAAYFVLSGEVTVGRGGKTFATLGPGSMLGLVALIDKGTRSASAVTTGPARLLRLSRREFELLFAAGNRFTFLMLDLVARQLVSHLRNANEMLASEPAPAKKASVQAAQGSSAGSESEEDLPQGEVLPLELEIDLDMGSDDDGGEPSL
jgi:CRP-like cAMP-binding protein